MSVALRIKWLLTAGTVVGALLLALALWLDFAGRAALWANLYWLLTAAFAMLASLSRGADEGRRERRVTRLVRLGLSSYFAGQLIWFVLVLLGLDTVPGPADALFLFSSLPIAAAFLSLPRYQRAPHRKNMLLLDTTITLFAIAVCVQVVLVPATGNGFEVLVQMLYPILFLAPTGAAMVVALENPLPFRLSGTLLLMFSWALLGVAFAVWTVNAVGGSQILGQPSDYAFGLGLILAGIGAASRKRSDTRPEVAMRFRLMPALIPISASLLAVALALWGASRAYSPLAMRSTAMLTLALVAVRQLTWMHSERKYERGLTRMIDDMPIMLCVLDEQDRVQAWNRECERVTGFGREEVLQRQPPRSLMQRIGSAGDRHDTTPEPQGEEGVVELTHRDGGRRYVTWTEMEGRFAFPTWASWAVGIDVTDRIRAIRSQRRLEQELSEARRLEAVGRLAGGVAHDFNNLLTVIRGNAEFLLHNNADHGEISAEVREILFAADRSSDLIQQLVTFSQQQPTETPEALDMGRVVRDLGELFARLLGDGTELELCGIERPSWVESDQTEIEQVLVNLVANARDAMPEGGHLTVRIASESETEDQVVIEVEDTGTGMSEEVLSRVFEPFFTTKDDPSGHGLGLATIYGIVKKWHGTIEVSSRENQGTTFRLSLPRTEAPGTQPVETVAPESSAESRRTGTILVAEDEPRILFLIERALTLAGHHVLPAANGDQALDLAQLHSGDIDLLITDVVMPGMSGFELAENLSQRLPKLRVIYCSGYAETAKSKTDRWPDGEHLAKPFGPTVLLERVEANLCAPSERSLDSSSADDGGLR